MSWIDDDEEEFRRRQQSVADLAARNQEIAQRAEKIYNDLWEEITARIAEAKSKGIAGAQHLVTNGDPYEREITREKPGHVIIVPQPIKPGHTSSSAERVNISLTRDRLTIVVSGLRNEPLRFPLDLSDDGVVRLKYEGEHKTIQEAAKLILRPVFHSELFPPK
jgi:hypothetical protein